jgi:FKBP-type peptidyl-prolyl cis-trans isomerase
MAQSPLRSFYVLLLLGVVLLALALAVRSGIFAAKDSSEPINAAMRAALAEERPELSTEDSLAISRLFPTAVTLKSGLRYLITARGEGNAMPKLGQTVTANYAGRFLDGREFDSSYKRGTPFAFTVGKGKVIPGWDQAFLGMRKGEKRTLIIPYWLAYGVKGKPPAIPPKATLVFDVELLDWK